MPSGLDLDGQRSPAGLCSQGRPQALVGQQRGIDPAGECPQVIDGRVQAGPQLAGDQPHLAGVLGGVLQQAELDRERDELLLGAVVQVALDPLPLIILRAHQPEPRRPQVVDRGLQLGGEPDVAEDKPGLRCQVRQQLVLGGGHRLVPRFAGW